MSVRFVACLPLLMLLACKPNMPAPPAYAESANISPGSSCEDRLRPLIDMLWSSVTLSPGTVFDSRVQVAEQEYELSETEPYYVLGDSATRELNDDDVKAAFVKSLKKRVGEKSESIPNPRDAIGTSWSGVFQHYFPEPFATICVLTLEAGDAEHVLVAGFKATANRATAVYVN